MSNPYDPQYGQQQPDPQEPQWGAPQYNQPQYDQPQYNQPAPNQPQYPPQPGYGQPQPQWDQQPQPQWNQPQYGAGPQYDQYGQPVYPISGPPQKNKGRTRGIIAAAAAVVVIGGGVGTYVAFTSSSGAGGGSSTPQAAVQTLVSDVNGSDLIGVLNDLAPGERAAIATPFQEQFNDLKKNGVITSGASASHLDGVTVDASDLTFGTPRTINDHVQVVPVTNGTIHVSADATKLPFTKKFLDLITHGQMSGPTKVEKTINVAQVERKTGQPVEVATQQVDGKWYPSLFYTIADYATRAAHLSAPSTSLPAVGEGSPDQAVRSMLDDLLSGKVTQAIELTSPDELQVLHDYGSLIVSQAHYNAAPFHIKSVQFSDTSIDDGTRVSLRSLTATTQGQQITVAITNSCVDVTAQGHSKKFCAKNVLDLFGTLNGEASLTAAQKTAIKHLFSAVSSIGIDTSESNGQWFVNPVRSYFDLSGEILGKLQPGDLDALIDLGSH